ncbi:MAG: HAD family phosphatase, partial [Clostridiales bacterium]|nr:HAD family phosphatase [Clostridiales bacterium]
MEKRLQLVIFDMDGLIFDTERLFMMKKNEILTEYGYPARQEDYVQTLGLSGSLLRDKLAELYGPDYPADEISAKTRAAVNTYMEENGPSVKPGVRKLLQWLVKRDIRCCVASSTRRSYAEKYLRLAGLEAYFSFAIGGEEVQRSKPEPDIFLLACERAGVRPGNALVLEDSENGIR